MFSSSFTCSVNVCLRVLIAFKIPWNGESKNHQQWQPCFIFNECINVLDIMYSSSVHRCSTSLIDLVTRTHAHSHSHISIDFCWSLDTKPFNRLALKVTLTVRMIFSKWCVLCFVDFFSFDFWSKMMKVTFHGARARLIVCLFSFTFIRVQASEWVRSECVSKVFCLYLALSWAFKPPFVYSIRNSSADKSYDLAWHFRPQHQWAIAFYFVLYFLVCCIAWLGFVCTCVLLLTIAWLLLSIGTDWCIRLVEYSRSMKQRSTKNEPMWMMMMMMKENRS